jgi:hypothetical protein
LAPKSSFPEIECRFVQFSSVVRAKAKHIAEKYLIDSLDDRSPCAVA